MKRKSAEPSPLVDAARSLDTELERFGSLVAAGLRERLDSPRSLERAAQALQQIPEVESRIRERLLALSQAFDATRRVQEQLADQAQKRSVELASRAAELQSLLGAHAALAEETKRLNESARELTARDGHALDRLHAGIASIVEHAAELTARARQSGFAELARTSDSMRQQVLALKNKLALGHGENPSARTRAGAGISRAVEKLRPD